MHSYVLDTNFLMNCSDIAACAWPHPEYVVVVPHAVLLDLDRINKRFPREIQYIRGENKRRQVEQRKDTAGKVADYLTRVAKGEKRLHRGSLRFVAAEASPLVQADPENCDLHIISVAREVQKLSPDHYTVFITFDRICFLLARSYGVNAVHLKNLPELRNTIESNYQWWTLQRISELDEGASARNSSVFELGKTHKLAAKQGLSECELRLVRLRFTPAEQHESLRRRSRIIELRKKLEDRYPALAQDYASTNAFLHSLFNEIIENVDTETTELLHLFEQEESLVLKSKGRRSAILSLLRKQIPAKSTVLLFDQNSIDASQLQQDLTKEPEIREKFGDIALHQRELPVAWKQYEDGQTSLLVASDISGQRMTRPFDFLIFAHCNISQERFRSTLDQVCETNPKSVCVYLPYMEESFSCEKEALSRCFSEVLGIEALSSQTLTK